VANTGKWTGTLGWGGGDTILKPSMSARGTRWRAAAGVWAFILLQSIPAQVDAQDAT
ncbi:uncharacterized protein METZ01_LOCUS330998, partial [marine metagenome]